MSNKKLKGIYGYFDTLKYEIIYIGKDSNIEEKARHKHHYYPSAYDVQQINRVLQNDKVGRYKYVEFDKGYYDNDTLNEKEIYWISYFEPLFNFTEGGEGTGLGNKHPNWKPEARVVKGGFNYQGKQVYGLRYKGKRIKTSINKDKLIKIAEKINKGIITVEEIKKIKLNKKDYVTVMKDGFTSYGKQKYVLINKDGKNIKQSINKNKLIKIAEKINKGIIIVGEIKEIKLNKKDYVRVIKGGFNYQGKQVYALKYNGKRIKQSINKNKLEKLAEKINKNKESDNYEF